VYWRFILIVAMLSSSLADTSNTKELTTGGDFTGGWQHKSGGKSSLAMIQEEVGAVLATQTQDQHITARIHSDLNYLAPVMVIPSTHLRPFKTSTIRKHASIILASFVSYLLHNNKTQRRIFLSHNFIFKTKICPQKHDCCEKHFKDDLPFSFSFSFSFLFFSFLFFSFLFFSFLLPILV
jgi:hypothetical protein